MKRKYLSAIALLGAIVSLAQADYVIIIANLGLTKDLPPAEKGNDGLGGAVEGRPGGVVLGVGGRPRPNPEQPDGQPVVPPAGEPDSTPVIVTAVVEVNKLNLQALQANKPENPVPLQLSHSLAGGPTWTSSWFQPSETIKLVPLTTPDGRPMPTVQERFKAKQTEVFKVSKPPLDKLLELAEWTLGHGLNTGFVAVMQKAAEAEGGKEHPAVIAFKKVEADLARVVSKDEDAKLWKEKLGLENFRITRSAHYALLHPFTSDEAPAVQSRLNRLEAAYRSFYYWFALKGKALPVPDYRLVAMLVEDEKVFRRLNQIFDSAPMVADGFYTPRDNVAVFSARRLDTAYHALALQSKELLTTYDQEQLLKGTARLAVPQPLPQDPAAAQQAMQQASKQLVDASTRAVLLKALEMDAERATVSHEGTRQLVAAAGLLPRNVATPEWVQFGMGSFFEVAKGSPWGGVGVPSPTFNDNFNYLFQYRKLIGQDRKLDKAALLHSVITDQLFRQAQAKGDDPSRLRARTGAWALTFFLAQYKLDGLLAYYQELNRLPRDLEFDDEVLKVCFARAFKLLDDKRPGQVDVRKFAQFAAEWHERINQTPLEADEMLKQVHKNQAEMTKPQP